VEQAQKGVKGRVTTAEAKPVNGAEVRVRSRTDLNAQWRKRPSKVDDKGYFWKILVPGLYEVQAFVPGQNLFSSVERVTISEKKRPRVVNFVLTPKAENFGDGQREGGDTIFLSGSDPVATRRRRRLSHSRSQVNRQWRISSRPVFSNR